MGFSDVAAAADRPGSDRLDTWKEVAVYLRRSVRTVQRWEREEGLPVHRHRHDKLGSIYAFKSELDAWWSTRGATLQDTGAHATEAASVPETAADLRVRRRRASAARPAGVVIAAGLVVAAISMIMLGSRGTTQATRSAARHEPHRLLITDFENLTGEPALAGRLRDALQEQLSASRFANIVPADQIGAMLRLMRKPANAPVDASVGREICLRDGAIDGFVTGTVETTASSYVATVRILTPPNANLLATFKVQGRDQIQLLDAVRREIVRVQSAMDEQFTHDQRRPELPNVTTAALHALDLYRQAVALMDQVPIKADSAFALLTEAIRVDPDFASAHILAAWALHNAGRGKEEVLPHAERAFALVDTTTEPERYFILGSYYQLKIDIEKAISAYEALLRLNPRHYWALGNLGRLYLAMGRHTAASELRARQVDIRPRQFWGPYRMAEALLLRGDLDGARRYAADAVSLVSQLDSGDMQSRRSWFDVLPACEAWLRDDVVESSRIAQDLEATLSQRAGADRSALTTSLGYWYLALGQRRAAERMFLRLPDTEGRLYHLAVVASENGESGRVRKYVAALAGSMDISFFMLGLPTQDARVLPAAVELVNHWEKKIDEPDVKLLHGQIALMRGYVRKARTLLEESIAVREDRFGAPALSASAGVASAWTSSGDRLQAIHVLEEASQNRFRSCLWPTASAHVWVRMRGDLARLYRQVGREPEAEVIEAQLRNLLKSADDPPVARLDVIPTGAPVAVVARNR
jgi:tetratricopeptide (TPR) repeat protein